MSKSPSVEVMGKKRRPQPHEQSIDSYNTPDTSDSDSNSDLEDDWDSDYSSENDEDFCTDAKVLLKANTDLGVLIEDLVHFSYPKLQAWKATAPYVLPPSHQRRPSKCARTCTWRPPSPSLKTQDDQGEAIQPKHYHFACPFFLKDPKKYSGCLMRHGLWSAVAVRRHVQRNHMKPLYCPMCYQPFSTVGGRDEHISARTCKTRERTEVDGINEYQRLRLSKRDKPYLSEKDRWNRIWKTVFPNSEPPYSPYLKDGLGLAMSMARDYWREFGADCAAEFLQGRDVLSLGQEDDGKAQVALAKLALKDLLERVVEDELSTEDGTGHKE